MSRDSSNSAWLKIGNGSVFCSQFGPAVFVERASECAQGLNG